MFIKCSLYYDMLCINYFINLFNNISITSNKNIIKVYIPYSNPLLQK